MAENSQFLRMQQLVNTFKAIHIEWLKIRTWYEDRGPDLDISGYGDEWLDAITTNLSFKQTDQPLFLPGVFRTEFHGARYRICALMRDRFAPWAYQVVSYFGIEAFPITCSTPPFPKHPFDINNPASRARLLTGTDDKIEAGKRMLLWGSAIAAPTPDDCVLAVFDDWAREFITFSDGICQPIPEAMEWIAATLDELWRAMLTAKVIDGPATNSCDEPSVDGPRAFGMSDSDADPERIASKSNDSVALELLREIPGTEENLMVVAILTKDLTVNEKLRAITAIDNRFLGYKGQRLADMLRVTRQAVEKTEWWKVDRPKAADVAAIRRRAVKD